MALAMVADGTCTHTGSTCSGSVAGTVSVGGNGFFSVESVLIMVDDGTFEVPTHNNPPCAPANLQSHSYTPNSLANGYFYIAGKRVVLVGDSYTTDPTTATGAGTNTILTVS